MKVLVCGGRDYFDYGRIQAALESRTSPIDMVIHGDASGADQLAGRWARLNGILEVRVPANWEHYGRRAGAIRNIGMLKLEPDLVIAFPGGRGTAHMINVARRAGIPVYEVK